MTFSPALQKAITKYNKCIRVYFKLISCDGQELYIRSHRDVPTPQALTSSALIADVGGTSQTVDFESAITTIGDISMRLLDPDRNLSNWMRNLSQCSLSGSEVKYYFGYKDVPFDQYYCAGTQIISSIKTKYKTIDIKARDVIREGRDEIFTEVCGKQFGNIYVEGSTLPGAFEREGTFLDMPEPTFGIPSSGTLASIWMVIDEPFNFSSGIRDERIPTNEGWLKKDCEIFRVRYHEPFFEPGTVATATEPGTLPLTGHKYHIIEREVFNSGRSEVQEDGLIISDGDEFCVVSVLEGPAPWVLYALMTGLDYDTDLPRLLDSEHAGIDPKYIDKSCFENSPYWDFELRFVCPKETKAKTFWEDQILRWLDAYFLTDCDGRLCLTPHEGPSQTNSIRTLTTSDIISCSGLTEESDIVKTLFVSWDYDPCSETLQNTQPISLQDPSLECLDGRTEICQFQGVTSSIISAENILSRMCRILTRQGVPKWSSQIVACIDHADLNPGDKIRVQDDKTIDYHSPNLSLDRVFEITSRAINWLAGTVTFNLKAPVKEPIFGAFENCFKARPSCATGYCNNGTNNLEDLSFATGQELQFLDDTTLVVPAGQTLNLPAGHYCFNNLVVNGTIRQSTPGTIGLFGSGALTINEGGKIDTSGMGHAGEPATASTFEGRYVYRADAYGTNTSQGGTEVLCTYNNEGDRAISCFCGASTFGSVCVSQPFADVNITSIDNLRGIVDQGGTFTDTGSLPGLGIAGNGGCAGGTLRTAPVPRNEPVGQTLGGAGGAGGGGLVLLAQAYNLSDGCIDTSGYDGQRGTVREITSAPDQIFGAISGSGAGGNAGRVLIVFDGSFPPTIGTTNFIRSFRGITPALTGGCSSNRLGSDNNAREEQVVQITRINCTLITGEQ